MFTWTYIKCIFITLLSIIFHNCSFMTIEKGIHRRIDKKHFFQFEIEYYIFDNIQQFTEYNFTWKILLDSLLTLILHTSWKILLQQDFLLLTQFKNKLPQDFFSLSKIRTLRNIIVLRIIFWTFSLIGTVFHLHFDCWRW